MQITCKMQTATRIYKHSTTKKQFRFVKATTYGGL